MWELTEISRLELLGQRHGGLAKRVWGTRAEDRRWGYSRMIRGVKRVRQSVHAADPGRSKQTKRAATIDSFD